MATLGHGVVTPNCKQRNWDYWFVTQELKFKVSKIQVDLAEIQSTNHIGSFKTWGRHPELQK